MGTRVHKVIGYGLTDVQHDNGTVTDPRFNMKRIDALRHSADEDSGLTVAQFYRWICCNRRRLADISTKETRHISPKDHKMDECLFLMHYVKRQRFHGPALFNFLSTQILDFYDTVIHAHEFGIPNVMLFQPFGCSETWSRHDDIIDYCEETAHHNSQSRCEDLGHLCGIFPYIGTMVRVRRPPAELIPVLIKFGKGAEYTTEFSVDDEGLPNQLQGGFYNQLVGRWSKNIPAVACGPMLTHFLEDWRPSLPIELLWMLTYMNDHGCFNDVEAIKQSLKPMLYVYWM